MNTVINSASGKPFDPLSGYNYNYARFEFTTAPPNRHHDAQSAVGYNCDSVRPSVFNCDWNPPGFSFTSPTN